MNRKFKRKFLAGLCALSSVGAIVKPAVENITYAFDMEEEITYTLPSVLKNTLVDIIWEFKENNGGRIGRQSSGAPAGGYDPLDTRVRLGKYISDKLVDKFKENVLALPNDKLSQMAKNSEQLKSFFDQFKCIGFHKPQAYDISASSIAAGVCHDLWEYDINFYSSKERVEIVCEACGMVSRFGTPVANHFMTWGYLIKKNGPQWLGFGVIGLALATCTIAGITVIPGMGKAAGKEVIASHLRTQSQKKELKQNLSAGSNHVLRLSKLDDNAINTIVSRMMNLVEQYPYAREMAGKIANQFVSDLLDKRANPEQNVGMVLAYGPPGSGKTKIVKDCLNIIYEATGQTGHKPLIISQSMIDENDKENSEANQAWGVLKKDVAGQKISSLSPFAAAVLSAEKYKDGLVYVLVDDADKFKEQVLRGLWDATDGGVIHINGVAISLSKVVFVMTANSDMTGVMDSLGGKAAKSSSSAFTSRCLKFLINAPKAENYKVKLSEMFTNLMSQYGSFNISDQTVDTLAKRCVVAEKGMRAVNEIRRVTKAMLLSPNYDPGKEIVPVPEGKDGWIEQN